MLTRELEEWAGSIDGTLGQRVSGRGWLQAWCCLRSPWTACVVVAGFTCLESKWVLHVWRANGFYMSGEQMGSWGAGYSFFV